MSIVEFFRNDNFGKIKARSVISLRRDLSCQDLAVFVGWMYLYNSAQGPSHAPAVLGEEQLCFVGKIEQCLLEIVAVYGVIESH